MGAAVPYIVQGGMMLGSHFLGKAASKGAMKRSPEEQQAMAGMTNTATQLNQDSNTLNQYGMPLMRQAGDWYSRLLGGDRGSMALATAAPRAAITDTYRGAAAQLEASPVRGGVRDLAGATLNRDKASRLAGLTTGVQPQAADALARLGGAGVAGAVGARTAAGNLYGGLLNSGTANRMYGQAVGADVGNSFGSMMADILANQKKTKTPTLSGTSSIGNGMAPFGPATIPSPTFST